MSDRSLRFRGGAAAWSESMSGRVRPRPNRPAVPRRRASRRVRPSQKVRLLIGAAPSRSSTTFRLSPQDRWLYNNLRHTFSKANLRRGRTMTPDGFPDALRVFLRRSPFRPFLIELLSGTRLLVEHTNAIEQIGCIGCVYCLWLGARRGPDSQRHVFDAHSVTMLLDAPNRGRPEVEPDFTIDLDSPGDEDGPLVLS